MSCHPTAKCLTMLPIINHPPLLWAQLKVVLHCCYIVLSDIKKQLLSPLDAYRDGLKIFSQNCPRGPWKYIYDQKKRDDVNFGIFEDTTFIFESELYFLKKERPIQIFCLLM